MIRITTEVGACANVEELLAQAGRRIALLVADPTEWFVADAELVRTTRNGNMRLPQARVKGRVVFEKVATPGRRQRFKIKADGRFELA